MSRAALAGIEDDYRHVSKLVTPGPLLALGERVTLKWYDIAPADEPVPQEIADLARRNLTDAFDAGDLDVAALGFVILHRCGDSFYFLLISTWSGTNELWETVWAKDGVGDRVFRLWPRPGTRIPTFCVWELAAVWPEQQAWSRFLRSARSDADVEAYLADSYAGPA